jgi:hypothetical protein
MAFFSPEVQVYGWEAGISLILQVNQIITFRRLQRPLFFIALQNWYV